MNERDEYLKQREIFYQKHKNFEEFCYFYSLDEEKIINHLKNTFFEGFRRPGSWEAQVVQSMFNIDNIEEEYGLNEVETPLDEEE